MKKSASAVALAVALCGSLFCSPVEAKTFVGVLWPMFGPLPAIGLVELAAELKAMPDVEVQTYVHQAWPSLVDDLKHLPPGTRTLIVGYSLGANSSVFVANNSKFIDTIIALQPSMLSWNPEVTGKVGHYIEIYNPNPWETFGGMGSKKLVGPNIEYIANNDSHPGAQFDPQFRDLVKSEVAKLVAQDRDEASVETARADAPKPIEVATQGQIIDLPRHSATKDRTEKAEMAAPVAVADNAAVAAPAQQRDDASASTVQSLQARIPPQPVERVADARPVRHPDKLAAFLDKLTDTVDSGDLSAERQSPDRQLTRAELADYAKRTYGLSRRDAPANQGTPNSGVITTASVAFDRP